MLPPPVGAPPARSHRKPMRISCLAVGEATLASVVQTATAAPINRGKLRRIACLLLPTRSVREGPDTEVVPDVPPETVESLGLDDQKEDDQRSEEDEAEVRDDVEDRRLGEHEAAECLHRVSDGDRPQRHEDRAQDRAE